MVRNVRSGRAGGDIRRPANSWLTSVADKNGVYVTTTSGVRTVHARAFSHNARTWPKFSRHPFPDPQNSNRVVRLCLVGLVDTSVTLCAGEERERAEIRLALLT